MRDKPKEISLGLQQLVLEVELALDIPIVETEDQSQKYHDCNNNDSPDQRVSSIVGLDEFVGRIDCEIEMLRISAVETRCLVDEIDSDGFLIEFAIVRVTQSPANKNEINTEYENEYLATHHKTFHSIDNKWRTLGKPHRS